MKTVCSVAILLSVPGYAFAHHSETGYDADSVAAFQGTVTEFAWRNPHAYIIVETENPDGTRTEWRVETGATPLLIRSGWTPEAFFSVAR